MSKQEKREILYLEYRIEKKRVVELERGNMLHRGKSTAKQYMDRGSKRGSKRERWAEELKEDV